MAIPFEWGLEYLSPHLDGLRHRENLSAPRDLVFDLNDQAIRDSDGYFSAPLISDFSFDGEWVSFPSQVQSPYSRNNTVHARYFPVAASGKARHGHRDAAARARRRAVIVLPQWNADAESHVGLCTLLNRINVAALRLSLPYHDRRTPEGLLRADYMVSANVGRTLQACRQAVLDVRGAVDWLIAQGYERIGIAGTSIGSCIAFLAFVHDERLRTGVYNHVSSYFGDVVWEGISTAHVRRGLETALNRDEVRRVWLSISPNAYIEKLMRNPRHGLLISARYDLSFPPSLSRLLFEECERQSLRYERRIVPCGHYSMGKTPFKFYFGYLAMSFFGRHL
jgi:hypothetical protein